jgi:hypothetical protein
MVRKLIHWCLDRGAQGFADLIELYTPTIARVDLTPERWT